MTVSAELTAAGATESLHRFILPKGHSSPFLFDHGCFRS
jgi:hypothetical protein